MAVNYRVKAVNNSLGLELRSSPVLTSPILSIMPNGSEDIADEIKTSIDGIVWFHLASYDAWGIYQYNGTLNMRILGEAVSLGIGESPNISASVTESMTQNILGPAITLPASVYIDENGNAVNKLINPNDDGSLVEKIAETAAVNLSNLANKTYEVINTLKDAKSGSDKLQQNAASYPTPIGKDSRGEYVYDWTTSGIGALNDAVKVIKRSMNIPSGYSRPELNILMNSAFNRYKITYPDYMPSGLSGVAFFTRPDLNLTDDSTGEFIEQVTYEPQLYYISRNNSMVLRQLTMAYSGSHEFLPLLCNTCKSLDVSDESIETTEVGETFSGNKMQYAKHNIKSMVAGTFSCRFSEAYDMAVTHLLQGWCTYESNVYLGLMSPKLEYISKGIIDYACDAYVFLVDRMNSIKFWTKYYGVFPISVGKSAFSYNDGDNQHFPEQNIQFAYFRKEDLDPTAIVEFNAHSNLPLNYKLDHEAKLGHGGNTWSGPPFVELKHEYNGTLEGSDQLYLRYRPSVSGSMNMLSDDSVWEVASKIALESMLGTIGDLLL